MCIRKSLNSLTQAQATRNIKSGVKLFVYESKNLSRVRDFNTLTEMTKMQASEIEQLDNKSFTRWCELSLRKVYSCFVLICLRFVFLQMQRANSCF